MNTRKLLGLVASGALVLSAMLASTGVASADPGSISWTGNGVTNGELDEVDCAENNGAPYIYWVFASSKGLTSPIIHFGGTGSGDYPMNDDNGTWKLQVGPWFDLDGLTAWVTFGGSPESGNPHLTISHGCPGETSSSSSSSVESSSSSSVESSSSSSVESSSSSVESSSSSVESSSSSVESSSSSSVESSSSSSVESSSSSSVESSSSSTSFSQTVSGTSTSSSPTEPNTATIGDSGSSNRSSGMWLLVAALGALFGSILVLTPSRVKNKE